MYSDIDHAKKNLRDITKKLFHRRTKRLLTDSEIVFQRYLDFFSLFTLFFLLFGIVMSLLSNVSILACSIGYGLFAILYGVIHLFFFFQRRHFAFYRFSILYGVIDIILGILFFVLPSNLSFLLLGVFFLVSTFEKFLSSFYLFRLHDQSFLVILVSSILVLFMGILLMINPFGNLTFNETFGLFSILFSVLNLAMYSLLQKKISEFVGCFD